MKFMIIARRFPNPVGANQPAEIEVRQLYEMADFKDIASPDQLERFKEMGME